MIGPIAKWAIKTAVSATEKAIQTNVAESKKAYREAEIRKEEEREAADPAYRAYKDAIREKSRLAEEESQRLRKIEADKLARKQTFCDLIIKLFFWV